MASTAPPTKNGWCHLCNTRIKAIIDPDTGDVSCPLCKDVFVELLDDEPQPPATATATPSSSSTQVINDDFLDSVIDRVLSSSSSRVNNNNNNNNINRSPNTPSTDQVPDLIEVDNDENEEDNELLMSDMSDDDDDDGETGDEDDEYDIEEMDEERANALLDAILNQNRSSSSSTTTSANNNNNTNTQQQQFPLGYVEFYCILSAISLYLYLLYGLEIQQNTNIFLSISVIY